jgi:hypothetical protein
LAIPKRQRFVAANFWAPKSFAKTCDEVKKPESKAEFGIADSFEEVPSQPILPHHISS